MFYENQLTSFKVELGTQRA